MKKIIQTLRLKSAGLTTRQIGASMSIPKSTISQYLKRAEAAGISWPLSSDMDDTTLERMLFAKEKHIKTTIPHPNCSYIHSELKRKGVTLTLLWEEYMADNPDGYRYTQFCHHYRLFRGKLNPSMRQVHKAGEKMFVDFTGTTVPIIDRQSGEIRQAEIFVAVLGASNYTFARAVESQALENWIDCHVSAYEFFGGVPAITVPDNLKSGVTRPCRYEPDINPTYQDMAEHYGTAVIPARVARPKDKPKVEVGVQVVTRWILASLRNHTFFSTWQLNHQIGDLLEKLNNKDFAKIDGNRRNVYLLLDKPSLLPLPCKKYEFAQFKYATVSIDYHIDVLGHYYSVPYQLLKEKVDVRITKSTVETFYKGKRISLHMRSFKKGGATTLAEHMPRTHREYLEWTPSRIINWASNIGPNCGELVKAVMDAKKYPEQGYRSALGIISLAKAYQKERVEAAAKRALFAKLFSYKSVRLILKNNLESLQADTDKTISTIEHNNIRGSRYYD